MPNYPAAHLLVSPDAPSAPDTFTVVRSTITGGLPHLADLTATTKLRVTLPTGLMQPWLHADPTALVSTSDDELLAWTPGSAAGTGASNPAVSLAVVHGGVRVAAVPAALDMPRRPSGDALSGVIVDIVLLGWAVFAGTLRGPGDFGSFVEFGWRTANQGASYFGPPVINPFLRYRLIPRLKIRSELGLLKPVLDRRFTVRRLALDVRG